MEDANTSVELEESEEKDDSSTENPDVSYFLFTRVSQSLLKHDF